MKRRSLLGVALAAAFPTIAGAAELPPIKTSAENAVPACATPGRMMAYIKARNYSLEAKFEKIAVEYMRQGEELGVRWDIAIAQMAIETNYLTYRAAGGRRGDVSPKQNNFAGIGATGGGVPGESFPDVATGVRAHLQHLLLYAGDNVENAVADRTRKVAEWGVLKSFHAKIKGPVTFRHLASKWATSSEYGNAIQTHADIFYNDFCKKDDPAPELLAEARPAKPTQLATAEEKRESKGAELARRAIEDGKAEGDDKRRGLGGSKLAKPQPAAEPVEEKAKPAGPAMTVLNAPRAEPDTPPLVEKPEKVEKTEKVEKPEKVEKVAARIEKPAVAQPKPPAVEKPVASETPADKADKSLQFIAASAAGLAATKPLVPLPPGTKCRVFTASYGGQKAVLIKSQSDGATNFTVLDVNEGAEKRESEAYIAAYAKNGAVVQEFTNQPLALDKAFELCPEG